MKKILFLLLFLPSLFFGQCTGNLSYTVSSQPGLNNTYPPGSTVELCITMDGWNGNSQGSNWFEGFFIALGGGWETVTPTLYPEDAEGDGSGTWIWATSTVSDNGATAGNGFYFEGPTGPLDGNAGNDWGDSCPSTTCVWSCCVELTAAAGPAGTDLHIGVIPYSDGTMGSWGTQMCNEEQTVFFTGSIGCFIPGCTDPLACNFSQTADCDDGTCTYPGCTDQTACNYNLNAGCNDLSCTYPGCADALACNFDPVAGCDDGSCDYFSMGQITTSPLSSPDTVCTGLEVLYSVTGDINSTYNWSADGGDFILSGEPRECRILWGNVTGTYTITAQETTAQGCIGEIQEYEITVVDPSITFNTTYYVCPGDPIQLSANPPGGTWSIQYMQDDVFTSNIPGLYSPSYTVSVYGCQITDFATVYVRQPFPSPELTYDLFEHNFCYVSQEQTYSVSSQASLIYFWNVDGVQQLESSEQLQLLWKDTTQVYEISVYGIDGFGCMTDTSYMTVKTEACNRLYIPNSFTPNNDKSNDVFGVFGSGVYEPKLRVYNKWGFCVFNSDSGSSHWTGSDGSGYYCPDGVYYWTLNYRDTYGFNRNEQGHVTLIR